MRKTKITGIVLFLYSFLLTSSIYDYSFTKIEGGTQAMSAYQGKKILIITLPIQQSASADSMLYSLDTLATAHSSSLFVIAVPSFEDGYTVAQQTQLQQWYRSKLGNYITIGEGVYTRKTSGAQQHGLFKWLTTDTMNEAFNMDVTGPGYKFFISNTGTLYAVLTPGTKMWGSSIQRTLQIQ
jgi:glutathione peroxidase-family protein